MNVNVKISDVANYRKDFITINNNYQYKRCRVQLHRRGIVLRDRLLGQDIKTKKQRLCRTNDFLVAEMDAKFGGYGIVPSELDGAIVSSHYYLFELDKTKILPEYLSVLIDTDIIQSQIKAKGSTNYSRVSPSEVADFEIPCPSLIEQQKIISIYLDSKKTIQVLNEESINQSTYLTKLRQSILQEAIEGKLTVDWRKENPGRKGDPNYDTEALLEKIQAEKEKLIKEGKIKKQKPLAAIKPEEVPFELPEGWVWTRLGEISQVFAGYSFNSYDFKTKNGAKCIKITNAGVQQLIESEERLPSDYVTLYKDFLVNTNDLIIALTRPYISNGLKISRCPESFNNALLNQRVAAIRNYFSLNWNYIFQFMTSDFVLNGYKDKFEKVNLQPNLKMSDVTELQIPLPPLAEQQAIVDRVEKLISMVDELEKQVSERKEQSEQLMQAVLREAFEGGK